MTLQQRIDCKHSFIDDTPYLKCEIDNRVCDGTLYQDCLLDRSFDEQMRLVKESDSNADSY